MSSARVPCQANSSLAWMAGDHPVAQSLSGLFKLSGPQLVTCLPTEVTLKPWGHAFLSLGLLADPGAPHVALRGVASPLGNHKADASASVIPLYLIRRKS